MILSLALLLFSAGIMGYAAGTVQLLVQSARRS
jgi:hypothetical protein